MEFDKMVEAIADVRMKSLEAFQEAVKAQLDEYYAGDMTEEEALTIVEHAIQWDVKTAAKEAVSEFFNELDEADIDEEEQHEASKYVEDDEEDDENAELKMMLEGGD